ncbi:MAG: hypothetical protein JNM12_02320 [Alphaproteobacteria bacterium]|nr:hypothetical protein [Alphaproteobacteria bacterium]
MNELKAKNKIRKNPLNLLFCSLILFLTSFIIGSHTIFAAEKPVLNETRLKTLVAELVSECPDRGCDLQARKVYFSKQGWREYTAYHDQLRKRIHVQQVKVWEKMHGTCPTEGRSGLVVQESFSSRKFDEIQYSSTRKISYFTDETLCAREKLSLDIIAFASPQTASGTFVVNKWKFQFPDAAGENCANTE